MKRLITYWITAILGFVWCGGIVAPWLVSNDELPLLIDMFLFILLAIGWVSAGEFLYKRTLNFFNEKDEKDA